jgi:predicted DNA-binding transcriptional regulator AlpA
MHGTDNTPHGDTYQPKLTWRLAEVAERTGMNKRTIQRMVHAKTFPPPTCFAGTKVPLWTPAVIEAWARGEWKAAPRGARGKAMAPK